VVIGFGPALTAAPGARREQVQDLTQQCADHLAAAVREHTEDWHMMQRVFLRAGEVVS
jgi:KDO2-lipid IV(A) lauroyltransferase